MQYQSRSQNPQYVSEENSLQRTTAELPEQQRKGADAVITAGAQCASTMFN